MEKSRQSPGAILNRLYMLREKKRKQQKAVDVTTKQFNDLKEVFIMAAHNAGTETIKSSKATGSIVKKMVANVKDWNEFEQWLYEHKALYMMYRRANVAPIREYMERAEDGKPPPGVVTLEVFDVSIVTRGDTQ